MNSLKDKHIVCLGGGIGTVNLIKGLRQYADHITVVVSMADDGGSAGRLRRLYNILPPGDLVSCMTSFIEDETLASTLKYRFPGNRYAKDNKLDGHKLGSLILVALRDITGDFAKAVHLFQKMFKIPGTFLPATLDFVSISAQTVEGKEINGEENIDLGKYEGEKILDSVSLHPKNVQANPEVVSALKQAKVIIVGPGDLYTTILPVLLVPQISKAMIENKGRKLFVVNVANKPFETKGYNVSDFVSSIQRHLSVVPFDHVIANNNFSVSIPAQYHYEYVPIDRQKNKNITFVSGDLVNKDFPLYHDSEKLAQIIVENI